MLLATTSLPFVAFCDALILKRYWSVALVGGEENVQAMGVQPGRFHQEMNGSQLSRHRCARKASCNGVFMTSLNALGGKSPLDPGCRVYPGKSCCALLISPPV